MNVSLPARMALPGWVSLAFPAWAAAAKQWDLWNGLTNVGFLDILATNGPPKQPKTCSLLGRHSLSLQIVSLRALRRFVHKLRLDHTYSV